jgi:hypothetical protein
LAFREVWAPVVPVFLAVVLFLQALLFELLHRCLLFDGAKMQEGSGGRSYAGNNGGKFCSDGNIGFILESITQEGLSVS